MIRASKFLRWATAAATLMLLAALAVRCAGLYLAGNAPENLSASGVHLSDVFTREKVSSALRPFAVPAMLWALLALAAGVTGRAEEAAPRARRSSVSQKTPAPRFPMAYARIALYAAAAGLVALGVINGGLRDVLVKAINICTECIGLG